MIRDVKHELYPCNTIEIFRATYEPTDGDWSVLIAQGSSGNTLCLSTWRSRMTCGPGLYSWHGETIQCLVMDADHAGQEPIAAACQE